MTLIEEDLTVASDVQLINELENRGYYVSTEDNLFNTHTDIVDQLHKLYLDYMLTGEKFFDDQLKQFFNRHLNTHLHGTK